MAKISIGTELVRPFMPAKDFDVSKRFYEALGFEKVLDGEVAISGSDPVVSSCSGTFRKTGPVTS